MSNGTRAQISLYINAFTAICGMLLMITKCTGGAWLLVSTVLILWGVVGAILNVSAFCIREMLGESQDEE